MSAAAHRSSIVGIAAWAVCACGKSQEPEIAQLAERELEAGAGIHAPVDEGKTTDAAAGRRSTDLLGGATWALPGPALQFQVGPVDPEPDKVAQSVPLTNGNVLAAYYRTDGYAVWAWYLELAPSDSGWRPVAVLYHEFLCVSFDWHGEGSLTGAVTVDPQVDRSVRRASIELENAWKPGQPLPPFEVPGLVTRKDGASVWALHAQSVPLEDGGILVGSSIVVSNQVVRCFLVLDLGPQPDGVA